MKSRQISMIGKRFFLVLSANLLIMAGCFNPFEPSQTMQGAEGEGFLTLNTGGTGNGRTILPTTVQNDFLGYKLVFGAFARPSITVERTNEDLGTAVILPAGTWDLTVTAFMDAEKTKPAARAAINGIVITEGTNTERNLELIPITGSGTMGTFRWNIMYPSDVVSAKMTITPLQGTPGTEQALYFTGGTPTAAQDNTSAPLVMNTGYYRVVFSLNNGVHDTGREEYLHIYQNMESFFEYTFTQDHFTVYSVTSNADSGPGTLRHAVNNAAWDTTIYIEDGVETINLLSTLSINKNLTIKGNGVTLTKPPSTAQFGNAQMVQVGSDCTVKIDGVLFKGVRNRAGIGVIFNQGTLILESCIFYDNRTEEGNGGAICNNWNNPVLTVKGCTFYKNSARNGGAIYAGYGTTTLTGNIFYGNTASEFGPVVYAQVYSSDTGVVTSGGYNVVDVALGPYGRTQCGWNAGIGDKNISGLSFLPETFQPLSGGGAAGIISSLPAEYPTTDFYGDPVGNGASAGAVQTIHSGYHLNLTVNNDALGSVSTTPASSDFVYSGSITLRATPKEEHRFLHWKVNGTETISENPLTGFTRTQNTTVQAVFARTIIVNNFTDDANSATTPGTLRYALSDQQDTDLIRVKNVTPGVTTITLASALPRITRGITIEGNGITLSPAAGKSFIMLFVSKPYSVPNFTVKIGRVHFKNGVTTVQGAAIFNTKETDAQTLILDSCIFSGNKTTNDPNGSSPGWGGAIYNTANLIVRGCTFYGNSSAYGGAIYNSMYCHITLTGNLFYQNTAHRNATNVSSDSGGISGDYNTCEWSLYRDAYYDYTNTPGGTGNTTFSTLGISGAPINTSTFAPVNNSLNIVPSSLADFPAVDFYGNTRTFPAAPGAVKY